MQGHDPDDPISLEDPVEPVTELIARGPDGLRIAVAGIFRDGLFQRRRPRSPASPPRSTSSARSRIRKPRGRAAAMSSPRAKAPRSIERLRTRAISIPPCATA
jgi:hypothetical protein